ncbi:MAG: tripartite tricarboxylate transporter TctB family protein [Peptococcaceae bacterium]|nr:tripartite tricarboxylate transporter TctB family protein [Peptococcaceae bacterium]
MKKRIIHQDVYMSIAMLIFAIVALARTSVFPAEAAHFPRLILGLLIVFTLWTLYEGIKKTKAINADGTGADKVIKLPQLTLPMATFLIVVVYTALIGILGFFTATTLFILGFMYFYQVRKVQTILLTLVGTNVFIYLLFVYQLNVPLPKGLFF